MKIIYHYGSLAGWPMVLARGFREIGIESINVVLNASDDFGTTNSRGQSNRQLKFDEALSRKSESKIKVLVKRLLFTLRVLRTGGLVHYHGGTILPFQLDAWLFRLFGIPTLISWGGGDARLTGIAMRNNPYFYRYEDPVRDAKIRRVLSRLARFGVQVATDPEMALYMVDDFPRVHRFRPPVNLNELSLRIPSVETSRPVVLHVPTHPFVKGTVHVRAAFEKLKRAGREFEPMILESTLTQAELRQKLSECDVYVDELRCGTYGYTAIEAAGTGKPTLTFILPDVLHAYGDNLPFVNTNADNLYENLDQLISSGAMRNEIGAKARKYVENFHATEEVLKQLLVIYRDIGWRDIGWRDSGRREAR